MFPIMVDSLILNQVDVLNTPAVENMDEPTKFKEDERPCTIVALFNFLVLTPYSRSFLSLANFQR